jgi:hypothetical protein
MDMRDNAVLIWSYSSCPDVFRVAFASDADMQRRDDIVIIVKKDSIVIQRNQWHTRRRANVSIEFHSQTSHNECSKKVIRQTIKKYIPFCKHIRKPTRDQFVLTINKKEEMEMEDGKLLAKSVYWGMKYLFISSTYRWRIMKIIQFYPHSIFRSFSIELYFHFLFQCTNNGWSIEKLCSKRSIDDLVECFTFSFFYFTLFFGEGGRL